MGAGRDTEPIIAFLPSMLKVRAGDTVTWKLNTDELHTVTFLSGAEQPPDFVPVPGGGPTDFMLNPQTLAPTRAPGGPVEVYSGTGFVDSAGMSDEAQGPPGTPPNNTFSLQFDTPGTYKLICLIHPFMRGQVEVLAATAEGVPSQAQIDAQGQKQLAPLLAELEGLKALRDSGMAISSEPGPNGTTTWFVNAGGRGFERFVELLDFLPKDVTIAEGDTVVWTSPTFHNVTFHPGRDAPELIVPAFQEQGPPQLLVNPEVLFPTKPSGEFDGTGFFSSGVIGLDTPFGSSFSMTFSKAGSYNYMCAIHASLGMKGNVTVVTRDQAGGLTNTIPFQDFGWDPNLAGATGSVTYRPLGGSFVANVSVANLKPSYTYNIYLMWNDLTGATTTDATSWPFTTDDQGAATVNLAKTLTVAEGAPLPALQVHFLVVDQNLNMLDPLLNPLGVPHPIALACSFPLGFLQLTAPGTPTVSLAGDSVPLFNYGWAPGFEGGSGSISYDGQNPSFERTVEVADLKADFEYTLFVMSSALNGDQTTMEIVFTTDSSGAGSVDISHTFVIPEGVPLPALQVHFLVLDKSVTLEVPANPLGIPNPIALACLFPLGFIQI